MSITFVLIKPDGVSRRLVGKIISRFEDKQFTIMEYKKLTASRELAEEHYAEHKGKDFFNRIIDYLTSGPVVAMVIQGEHEKTVETVRLMIGSTSPEDASPGTIRGDYGTQKPFNVIHSSDSRESADREIALWFKQ